MSDRPTTLDPQFLRAVILVSGFRPRPMETAQIALLCIGLRGGRFCAADLPGEITHGDQHIAGCACGSLASTGLIECVGRMKSPRPDAKGRKLDVWEIPGNKRATAEAWLRAHGVNEAPRPAAQVEMVLE